VLFAAKTRLREGSFRIRLCGCFVGMLDNDTTNVDVPLTAVEDPQSDYGTQGHGGHHPTVPIAEEKEESSPDKPMEPCWDWALPLLWPPVIIFGLALVVIITMAVVDPEKPFHHGKWHLDIYHDHPSNESHHERGRRIRSCHAGGDCSSLTEELLNADEVEYYGTVHIGSPPQAFQVCFDTGSGTLWVPSSQCTGEECSWRTKFDPAASKTYQAVGSQVQLDYGRGKVGGILAEDMVSMGPVPPVLNCVNHTDCDLAVTEQRFVLANTLDGFPKTQFTGVMGLAKADAVAVPWFHNLWAQGKVADPVFSMYYSNSDSKPGKLSFGAVDKALYTGDIQWHQTGPGYPAYWTTFIQRIEVGSEVVWRCNSQACEAAMLDSGTSLIVAPRTFLGSYNAQHLTASEDCSNLDMLPPVTFYFPVPGNPSKSVPYTLKGRDYTLERYGTCTPGLAVLPSANVPQDKIILGDVFIRKFFTVFDFESQAPGEGRLGFAVANQQNIA